MTTSIVTTNTTVTTTKTVVTHNGLFHADEGFGVAFLNLLLGPEMRVVRTRNPAQIEQADVALDVGGIYDNGKFRYDHHQTGFDYHDDGQQLQSAGYIFSCSR